MNKVLVTGATGLLATNTIFELVAQGYYVKALVRDKARCLINNLPNTEVIESDFENYSSVENALKDCHYIIHAAGETRLGLINYDDYRKSNVSITGDILKIAVKMGVKRFIYISTCNVYGYGTKESPGDETKKIDKLFSKSKYVKSKLEAQQLVLSYSDKIDVVIINPTFLIGAYDQKPGSGRIVIMAYQKKILFYPPGGKSFIDVKDAAAGIIQAMPKARNREKFILAGENLSYKEFFTRLNVLTNTNPVMIKIPGFVLKTIGLFGDLFIFFGIATEISSVNMRLLCVKNFYSNAKAEKELTIKFHKIDKALNDAVNWYIKNGYLKGKNPQTESN